MMGKSTGTIFNSHNHQHKDKLCFHCNELQDTKDKIIIYEIKNRGYGSIYDCDEFQIQLCPECAEKLKVNKDWFDNEKMGLEREDGTYDYFCENNIKELVDKFPTYNQEYISNCYNSLMPYMKIDRDDWLSENL